MRHRMGLRQMLVFCLGGVVLAGAAIAFGFTAIAPFLLLGGCALMMIVMMRMMSGGGHDDHDRHDGPPA